MIKVNTGGDVIWNNVYGSSLNESFTRFCKFLDNTGYLAVGYTNGNDGLVSGNHGESDIWVVKVDSTGNLNWQRCLGGSANESVNYIQSTFDGGYIIIGGTDSNNGDISGFHGGDSDVWVVKLNSAGAIEWQKCLGGSGSGSDSGSAVVQTPDGGYVVVASTNSNDGDVTGNHGSNDIWVAKLSSSGTIQWQKCLGGSNSDTSSGIQQTPDGGFVIVGATSSDDGDVSWQNGGSDYWVVKLKP